MRPQYTDDFKALKGQRKISMLTAYGYSIASILNETRLDAVLVGDSVSNVVLGNKDTISVNFSDIIHHTKAVVRGFNGLVIADIPFMSYLDKTSFYNGVKHLMQSGAKAVKIEGANSTVLNRIEKLIGAGVPVMGHLGLTPQSYLNLGGYKYQGKTDTSKKEIIHGAKKLESLGVFAIVLECIPDSLAKDLTASLSIPTIGIGSGANTDGQILVVNDMLNLGKSHKPSFVKQYADLNSVISKAVNAYIEDIGAK